MSELLPAGSGSGSDLRSDLDHMIRNRYYILRHGESEANIEGLIVSDPARGVPGYGLTPTGRDQVRRALGGCTGLGPEVHIVASDFRRARETAELAREALGVPGDVRLEPALRERFFGAWEGTPAANYRRVWEADATDPASPGPGVEAAASVLHRARALIDRLEADHRGATFLLVTHGDVAQILLATAAGLPPWHHRRIPHLETGAIRALR